MPLVPYLGLACRAVSCDKYQCRALSGNENRTGVYKWILRPCFQPRHSRPASFPVGTSGTMLLRSAQLRLRITPSITRSRNSHKFPHSVTRNMSQKAFVNQTTELPLDQARYVMGLLQRRTCSQRSMTERFTDGSP